MAPAGFEIAIPGGEQAHTNAVDMAATGTGLLHYITLTIRGSVKTEILRAALYAIFPVLLFQSPKAMR